MYSWKRFSPIFVGYLFSLVTVYFAILKLFSFMQSHLSILSLHCWANGILFRKLFPIPVCSSIFHILSYINCTLLYLTLRSLIQFELILVQGERLRFSLKSFTFGYPIFSVPLIEEAVFSPLYALRSFVKNQLALDVWICVWVFYFAPFVFMYVSVPVPWCMYVCNYLFLWYWGLNLRRHLEPLTSPFLWWVFKIGTCELFAWAGFEPQSYWSLPLE
jgi:hypothetical protein